MARQFWRGLALPLLRSLGGYFASKDTNFKIFSSIVLILGTPIGSRLMLPEFGSYVPSLLFEPNDTVLKKELEYYSREAIARWEPRVRVLSTVATPYENSITIRITYVELTTQQTSSLDVVLARSETFRLIALA